MLAMEVSEMTKQTITRFFVGSVLAIAGGFVLTVIASLLAFANGSLVYSGPDVVGVNESAFGWAMITVAVVGILAMAGGAIGQFVSWIGAVLNTSKLEDKTWFVVLLLLGLFSFGFIAMLVYVIAGPDGTEKVPMRGGLPARPAPTA
jgi:hypothetical protein